MENKTTAKNKGSNTTRSKRYYISEDPKKMKDSVELYKAMKSVGKLTQEQRSSLAYFQVPIGTSSESS
jgi:hypothetical protein